MHVAWHLLHTRTNLEIVRCICVNQQLKPSVWKRCAVFHSWQLNNRRRVPAGYMPRNDVLQESLFMLHRMNLSFQQFYYKRRPKCINKCSTEDQREIFRWLNLLTRHFNCVHFRITLIKGCRIGSKLTHDQCWASEAIIYCSSQVR